MKWTKLAAHCIQVWVFRIACWLNTAVVLAMLTDR